MRERRISGTTSLAMQWLLNLLNGDFLSGAASPHEDPLSDSEQKKVKQWIAEDLARGTITQEQAKTYASSRAASPAVLDVTEQTEVRHLQAVMVSHVIALVRTDPVGTDPEHLADRRRTKLLNFIRQAKRGGDRKKERILRQQLAQEPHLREATRQRDREEGLRAIAAWLSEWAQGEQLYPWWQIDPPLPDDLARVHADQQYRIGAQVFTVSQWPGRPKTLTAKGMMNLGACLVSGELNRLRVCKESGCVRYFYAEDFRLEHCSEACRRRNDGQRAVDRMRRMRKKRDAAAKALFLDTIPTLRVGQFRALEGQGAPDNRALALLDDLVQQFPSLNDRELALLGDLVKQSKDGRSLPYLWKEPRVRRLFKKVYRRRATSVVKDVVK